MRLLLFALILTGCERSVTQLVVAVDTDYAVPGELSHVRARIESGGRSDQTRWDLVAADPVDGQVEVPFSFGVTTDDPAREVLVIVEGYALASDGAPLVAVRAQTGFIEGKSLRLPLFLAKSCEGVWATCTGGETCQAGVCDSNVMAPDTLEIFDPKEELIVDVPRRDAGDADGGFVDGGVDAGIDAGPQPDCGAVPAEVAIGFEPNVELLAADLDGDGITEIAAARSEGAGSSPIAIVDFDDCAVPAVTATAAYGELRQGLVASGQAFYSVEKRRISRWTYAAGAVSTSVLQEAGDIERLAFTDDGSTGMAVVNLGSWSYQAFDPISGPSASIAAPERPKSFSAHLSGSRFVHADDMALRSIDPGADVQSLRALVRPRDPVVVTKEDDLFVGSIVDDRTLQVLKLENDQLTSTTTRTFSSRIVSGPIPLRKGSDIELVVLLEDGTLTGCKPDGDRCESIDSRTFDPADVDDQPRLLSALVDGDTWPDVIFVAKRGRIFFARGHSMDQDAAPSLDLGVDTRGGPAIRESMLVVQHDGMLSLVRIPGIGPGADVWPQVRRGPGRSAAMR